MRLSGDAVKGVGLGFRVFSWFLGFEELGMGLGLGLRVWGLRFRIQDLRHHGSTFLVEGGECSVSAGRVLHIRDHGPKAGSKHK